MDKTYDICSMKERLSSYLNGHIDEIDVRTAGEMADIIKDLAEAEKLCYETKYYQSVVEAMEEAGEASDRMGYNRNISNGRFAPNMNRIRGYKPYIDQEPYIDAYLHDPSHEDNMRMGYSGNSMAYGNRNSMNSRYGQAYNDYRMAKRYYTQTNNISDKEEMDGHMTEYVNDVVQSLKEMWADADATLKKKMKSDLTMLVNEMVI